MLLLLKRGDQGLDEADALLCRLRAVHEEFVVSMGFKLRRLFAECAANTFPELELCSGPGRVQIGEAFSPKVFYLSEKFPECADAAGELFNCGGFGASAGLFRYFCSCHNR